jgi:hypothetical protein
MAATLAASLRPSVAPTVIASSRPLGLSCWSTAALAALRVSGSPVSGSISFATTSKAGAHITLQAIRFPAMFGTSSRSMITYAASTPPAVVAKPAVMQAISSERVSFDR